MSLCDHDGTEPSPGSRPKGTGEGTHPAVAQFLTVLDEAEASLGGGNVPDARTLLTGLEPRLMVAGLGSLLPRFFRLAAECERQEGNLGEAVRLCTKGLTRLHPSDTDERRRLVDLGRQILQEAESDQT